MQAFENKIYSSNELVVSRKIIIMNAAHDDGWHHAVFVLNIEKWKWEEEKKIVSDGQNGESLEHFTCFSAL